jgi:hypothetical protein
MRNPAGNYTAILIMTFTAFKSPVILAGMPVSSHRDVKPQGDGNAKSSTYALSKLPSMALDFGIPAKMTAHIAIMRIAGNYNNNSLKSGVRYETISSLYLSR